MGMGTCRECGALVADSAPTCVKCGATKPVVKNVGVFGWLIAIAFGLILFKVIAPAGEPGNSMQPTRGPTTQELISQAKYGCKTAVLKSAHDADSVSWIAAYDWPTTPMKDDVWQVSMSFRAKNGFGAVILNKMTCNIQIKDDSYRIIYLN